MPIWTEYVSYFSLQPRQYKINTICQETLNNINKTFYRKMSAYLEGTGKLFQSQA